MSRRGSSRGCFVLVEDALLDKLFRFRAMLEGLVELVIKPSPFQLGLLALQGWRDLGVFEDVLIDELPFIRSFFEGSLEPVASVGVAGRDGGLVEGDWCGIGIDGERFSHCCVVMVCEEKGVEWMMAKQRAAQGKEPEVNVF